MKIYTVYLDFEEVEIVSETKTGLIVSSKVRDDAFLIKHKQELCKLLFERCKNTLEKKYKPKEVKVNYINYNQSSDDYNFICCELQYLTKDKELESKDVSDYFDSEKDVEIGKCIKKIKELCKKNFEVL